MKGDIHKYLNWHKEHLKLGIDIRNVREMKVFLFGYSKGLIDAQKESNIDWVDAFNEFAEKELQSEKPSSYDWSRHIYENQVDDKDGLEKFYSLLDRYFQS